MNYYRLFAFVLVALAIGCAEKKNSLSDQLSAYLASHLRNIDSTVTVKSMEVLRIDSINGKIGLIMEDSTYSIERNGIQAQLDAVKAKNRPDSAAFYQEEINYMNQSIDSIRRLSATNIDTTRKYGVIAKAVYEIARNGLVARDTVYYIIAMDGTIYNANRLDATLQNSISRLH